MRARFRWGAIRNSELTTLAVYSLLSSVSYQFTFGNVTSSHLRARGQNDLQQLKQASCSRYAQSCRRGNWAVRMRCLVGAAKFTICRRLKEDRSKIKPTCLSPVANNYTLGLRHGLLCHALRPLQNQLTSLEARCTSCDTTRVEPTHFSFKQRELPTHLFRLLTRARRGAIHGANWTAHLSTYTQNACPTFRLRTTRNSRLAVATRAIL